MSSKRSCSENLESERSKISKKEEVVSKLTFSKINSYIEPEYKQLFLDLIQKKREYEDFGELGTILDIVAPTNFNIPEQIVRQKYPFLDEYLDQIRRHNNGIKVYYKDVLKKNYFDLAPKIYSIDWKQKIKFIVKSTGYKEYYKFIKSKSYLHQSINLFTGEITKFNKNGFIVSKISNLKKRYYIDNKLYKIEYSDGLVEYYNINKYNLRKK